MTEVIFERLDRIESLLEMLVDKQRVQDWYTAKEFARAVGKAEWTVTNWFRQGRINAIKNDTHIGVNTMWKVSNDELLRYRRDGLLPIRK